MLRRRLPLPALAVAFAAGLPATLACAMKTPADPLRRTYDVTDQIRGLRQRGEWKGPLRVTFVRERLDRPASTEPVEFLRFTRVALLDR